jgi:starch phosphorylase
MKRSAARHRPDPRIAYLSMEVGLESGMPTYSGGLGVLAGDTLRAAADLHLPMVGVTLVHREGYFRQELDEAGRQSTSPDPWSPEDRLDEAPARVVIQVGERRLDLRAWVYPVTGAGGHVVPVYLLDADLPGNSEDDRRLTDRLYGGDERYRLLQEAILGLGGAALLDELGFQHIRTFHMNEGHSALLPLALLSTKVRERPRGRATKNDDEWVRERCVFTTHTPVPAGHDRFHEDLVEEVLGEELTRMLRGRGLDHGVLNMTELALHFSRFVNGVALRHAQVSRLMFPTREIHAITNGVHVPTWTSPALAELFDRHVPDWRVDPLDLRHACVLPLDELRAARGKAKAALIRAVRERTGRKLAPDVLTLGFARRATPYKRTHLLFSDLDRLRAVADAAGGLQVVYAGKAHPRDLEGQERIRRIHEAAAALGDDVPVVYLQGYDMELGGLVTAGVDVWLNNPEKPKEASGTSGMKAALNGVPNLSVVDGWWVEGHVEGVTGWSIGGAWDEPSDGEAEAADLYRKLETVVAPLHRHDREGGEDLLEMRRASIALNGPHFSTRRMMAQYMARAYRVGEGAGSGAPARDRRRARVGSGGRG